MARDLILAAFLDAWGRILMLWECAGNILQCLLCGGRLASWLGWTQEGREHGQAVVNWLGRPSVPAVQQIAGLGQQD